MNSLKRCLLILIFFGSVLPFASAQEKLFPVYENTQLNQAVQPIQPNHKIPKSNNKTQALLSLPFFDDFSKYTGYPDDNLWLDNEVYINTGYPINPPTTGVATFDGLNSAGRAYEPGSPFNGAPTDTLTSAYIDLSQYTNHDSIYFSFFYQPGGLGETPDIQDSLILEFKPDSVPVSFDTLGKITEWSKTVWVRMWAIPGSDVYPFKIAMIPVSSKKDTNFFQQKFQFRFRALGNQSGNLDIWNIDYVYMRNNRTWDDTTFTDLAIYQPSKSIINNYYSIPWNYFETYTSTYYTDSIHIYTHNNDAIGNTKHVTFSYNIKSLSDNTVLASRTSTQVANVNGQQYLDFKLQADPLKPSFVPKNPDSVVLAVQTIAVPNVLDYYLFIPNDTATNLQVFNTYLAYDDGSAEQGYGITNTNTPNPGSKVALRFDIPMADTLYGIGIHFNQSLTDVSNDEVSLMAWSSIDTINSTLSSDADKVIGELDNVKPQYTFQRNGFYYFPLDTPRAVSGSFYLGWSQTSDFLFNVGFDRNYTWPSKLYYNLNGGWYKSSEPGVPMIRAYVGKKPVIPASVNSNYSGGNFEVNVYPNPSKDQFTISLPDYGKFKIDLVTIDGKIIATNYNLSGDLMVNTGIYPPGVYIVKVTDQASGSRIFKKVVLE